MLNWLRRAVRVFMSDRGHARFEMGLCPGMVWDEGAKRWVDESITWQPGPGRYSLVGPVYRISNTLQP
jgi:hypothetical protein